MRVALDAKVDWVTFDGADGGIGITPIAYLEAQVLRAVQLLKKHERHVPDILMAEGFINETQIIKAIAMSNFGNDPFVEGVVMARSPLTVVMKATYYMELYEDKKLPKMFIELYGDALRRSSSLGRA